jgi:Histidine phosphatase superfamily (branch 1)
MLTGEQTSRSLKTRSCPRLLRRLTRLSGPHTLWQGRSDEHGKPPKLSTPFSVLMSSATRTCRRSTAASWPDLHAEIERSNPGLLAQRRSCLYDWRFPGGESYSNGNVRAASALQRIKAAPARPPVLITCEMIARMSVRDLLGLSPEDALDRSFAQGTVYQVTTPGYILAIT